MVSFLVIAVVAGGCGSGSATPPATKTSTATTARDPSVLLNGAVRQALRKNYELSGYVLWHNATTGQVGTWLLHAI